MWLPESAAWHTRNRGSVTRGRSGVSGVRVHDAIAALLRDRMSVHCTAGFASCDIETSITATAPVVEHTDVCLAWLAVAAASCSGGASGAITE